MLRLLQQRARQRDLAFCGGTALRLLHGLPRFSEDLEFAAAGRLSAEEIRSRMEAVATGCRQAGYRPELKIRTARAVAAAMFRFPGLPKELGIHPDPRRNLSIKIEIDGNPPAGAGLERSLLQRHFPLALLHHDLPTLFAGKLHAILARPWSKGRDWYDLVWYLTTRPDVAPNPGFLAAALAQTGHDPAMARDWARSIASRLAGLDFRELSRDVGPFLERPGDWDVMEKGLIRKLIEKRFS